MGKTVAEIHRTHVLCCRLHTIANQPGRVRVFTELGIRKTKHILVLLATTAKTTFKFSVSRTAFIATTTSSILLPTWFHQPVQSMNRRINHKYSQCMLQVN